MAFHWATNAGAEIEEPPNDKKAAGWRFRDGLSHKWLNWFWHQTTTRLAAIEDTIRGYGERITNIEGLQQEFEDHKTSTDVYHREIDTWKSGIDADVIDTDKQLNKLTGGIDELTSWQKSIDSWKSATTTRLTNIEKQHERDVQSLQKDIATLKSRVPIARFVQDDDNYKPLDEMTDTFESGAYTFRRFELTDASHDVAMAAVAHVDPSQPHKFIMVFTLKESASIRDDGRMAFVYDGLRDRSLQTFKTNVFVGPESPLAFDKLVTYFLGIDYPEGEEPIIRVDGGVDGEWKPSPPRIGVVFY